ncbi:phosphatase PAP2 family protein [Lewinella sp. 4G2]|uniref:phosphatase PAP2 family protein n=1 Tax=Lewinella sp. 4G2 TaxID=1803372 RepID=UPI0007B48479|nr:phosphatase PAP2 family protein [Lewinella sp. 4G2]OAV45252.1 hypothetical protein A3850_012440 [Lewinella sp. 4G2]
MIAPKPQVRTERWPSQFAKQNWPFLVVALLLVLGNSYLLFTSNQGDALIAINQLRRPAYDVFFKVGTHFAEPVAYVAVVLIVSAFSYRKAIFSVVSGAVAGILAGLAKLYFGQARPMRWFFDNYEEVWHGLNHFEEEWRSWDAFSSFPSGHTASAFALYGFLAFNARRGKLSVSLVCLAIAVMVGFSRMYLLYHFLRDVTAGAVLGLLVAISVYYLQDRLSSRYTLLDIGWADRFRKLPPVQGQVPVP